MTVPDGPKAMLVVAAPKDGLAPPPPPNKPAAAPNAGGGMAGVAAPNTDPAVVVADGNAGGGTADCSEPKPPKEILLAKGLAAGADGCVGGTPKDERPLPNGVWVLVASALPPKRLVPGGFVSMPNIDGWGFWAAGVDVTTVGGTVKLSLGTVDATETGAAACTVADE